MYDRALKNLAAPKLLPMRPRIKANVGQKILNKAFAQQVELPDTSYDFFLRLQCAVPDAQHRVPVHAVKKRLEAKQQTPDDVLLFTMMRGYALCGDVTNAQQCMQSLGKVSGEAYAHLALAHAVNGDANGILEVAHDARSGSKPRCTSPSHSSHRFLLLLPPTHSFTHIYIQPHPQNFVHRGAGNSRTADHVPRCWRQPSTTWLRSAPPRTLRRCLRPLKSPTCVFA